MPKGDAKLFMYVMKCLLCIDYCMNGFSTAQYFRHLFYTQNPSFFRSHFPLTISCKGILSIVMFVGSNFNNKKERAFSRTIKGIVNGGIVWLDFVFSNSPSNCGNTGKVTYCIGKNEYAFPRNAKRSVLDRFRSNRQNEDFTSSLRNYTIHECEKIISFSF